MRDRAVPRRAAETRHGHDEASSVVRLLGPGVWVAHPREGLAEIIGITEDRIEVRFRWGPISVTADEFRRCGFEVLGHPTHDRLR